MSVFSEILAMALQLVEGILQLYIYVVFASVVISWVGADPYNGIVRFIQNVTEPLLAPVRRKMWRWTARSQIDFSPMVVIFAIMVIQIIVRRLRFMLLGGVPLY